MKRNTQIDYPQYILKHCEENNATFICKKSKNKWLALNLY